MEDYLILYQYHSYFHIHEFREHQYYSLSHYRILKSYHNIPIENNKPLKDIHY
ncbi:hypothetical protein LPJ60_006353, partial [Coemansia sp. RSA 2675]